LAWAGGDCDMIKKILRCGFLESETVNSEILNSTAIDGFNNFKLGICIYLNLLANPKGSSPYFLAMTMMAFDLSKPIKMT
jgi:hypothetical protein